MPQKTIPGQSSDSKNEPTGPDRLNLSTCKQAVKLSDAIHLVQDSETASFHTPGHKGRPSERSELSRKLFSFDMTELPGLDDLSFPEGVLLSLCERAQKIYQSRKTFLSTGGASAGVMAAVIAVASRGQYLVVPRNCHRSVINAMVLTGLKPLWYEPDYDSEWGFYGSVFAGALKETLADFQSQIAAVVVVSPTYAGALSDIAAISRLCRSHRLELIVDEAHGAHLTPSGNTRAALASGAGIVIHSLHKTLSAVTQTGLLHLGVDSMVDEDTLRIALSMVTSSSPNYLLLASVEEAIAEIADEPRRLATAIEIGRDLRLSLEDIAGVEVYQAVGGSDPLHVTVKVQGLTGETLKAQLAEVGINVETVLGAGVLCLLGSGSEHDDAQRLTDALRRLSASELCREQTVKPMKTGFAEQVMQPRQAFFAPSRMVALQEAEGLISAECVAPCPPGIPLLVPGQRIGKDVLKLIARRNLRVLVESNV